MEDNWCMCLARNAMLHDISYEETFFAFLLSLLIILCGVFLNYKLWKKLKTQKKNRPFGRKGNVVEPLARCFCAIQIIYWPYHLLLIWGWLNNVIPLSRVPSWLCPVSAFMLITGSTIIGYNSLFIALIRYLYIVHERKANQWNFDDVSHKLKIASVCVPTLHFILLIMTFDVPAYEHFSVKDSQCEKLTPMLVTFTARLIPKKLVDIFGMMMMAAFVIVRLNLVEGFLYFVIFQTIRR